MEHRTSKSLTHITMMVENHLLGKLQAPDLDLLFPLAEAWSPPAGHVLLEPGDTVDYSYFPCGPTLVSFRVVFADGASIETALVGREGAVGGIVSQGTLPAFTRAIVQHPGPLIRIQTARLEEAKLRSSTIRHLLARYADCLLAQVFQATACNAVHSIEQRMAKWLLEAVARTGEERVPLTQEQLAGMLGVGRSYINRLVANWKHRGLLRWHRGVLSIDDMDALRTLSCACNEVVRAHFDEVLDGVYPRG